MRSRGTAGTASTRTSKSIWLVSAGSIATAVALLCTAIGPVDAAPKPPPNPSDSQLAQASIQKSMLAHTVGVLSAELASAQAQLHSLAAQAELAEQRFAEAEAKLNTAKENAAKAQARGGQRRSRRSPPPGATSPATSGTATCRRRSVRPRSGC